MKSLAGHVALVTGSGQGVGRGIAVALAERGADVAVVGRTLAKLEDSCAELAGLGVTARPYEFDVTDHDGIPGLVDRVVGDLGRLDVLVNNAYVGAYGPLLGMSRDDFERGFRSGPFAAFEFMKAAHPHLVAQGGGSIVNLVTSAMVRWDPTTYGAYAAAKTALRSLTRTVAVEWGPDNIRVNSIAPHALSPGLAGWAERNPEEAEAFVASIPLRRIGDPVADIGRAVAALVSPELQYLSGATIPLDGAQAFFG
ncbi:MULTISPECIES: SDR family NAD(P)-dependent oxidoreductase [unclassified Nocardioides]|uniref:SDR family NAD(P)-dependent oxidoreductase n=1 Tax=unclassified Nocardioides TaxID=2615069 RepID=UPI0006F2DFCC|nr:MULTISPECIES: SDR family oxidoreductase [unclassified Nocardioides]KQY50972.1 3-oxoacyl-ACP reductase [Nocardioides sp. Root140]KQZ75531.1 3-oxoacyl-ACP reductase [Nocardioides sp. Root151]KRF14607.1 3-oxoacyl-ACP reductase [Nocardioides sp. Soil796]